MKECFYFPLFPLLSSLLQLVALSSSHLPRASSLSHLLISFSRGLFHCFSSFVVDRKEDKERYQITMPPPLLLLLS